MNFFKNILTLFILVILIIASKCTHAQKFYYFENVKTGKKITMGESSINLKLEFTPDDSNVIRIYKEIYCLIDLANSNNEKICINKQSERIETHYKDGTYQIVQKKYIKKGNIINYREMDTILVNDIVEVTDRSGYFNRYKFFNTLTQISGVTLFSMIIVGPFVFNDYFKIVGISFVSSIPVFVLTAIFRNMYILQSPKQPKKTKWKLVYK